MAAKITFDWEGFQEFEELINQMVEDFGEKDTRKIMRNAVKDSMAPVLMDAKLRAPTDTGALQASLQIEARKPTGKDRKSKYVDRTDAVIASVTTAPGWKLKKTAFFNRKNKKSDIKQVGINSDARAVAMEFGTAKVAAKPFLRPALESNKMVVVDSLGDNLKVHLERYKARAARRAKR